MRNQLLKCKKIITEKTSKNTLYSVMNFRKPQYVVFFIKNDLTRDFKNSYIESLSQKQNKYDRIETLLEKNL